MTTSSHEILQFAEKTMLVERVLPVTVSGRGRPLSWKIAIVDDDEEVHAVTKLVLSGITYKDGPVQLLSCRSGEEAKTLFARHPDIAVALLDVVMETDRAGLDVVRYIREELGNRLLRIILRTGQPGDTPESEVMADYDINDYREKADLTAQKLLTAVTAGLRAFDDLRTIRNLVSSNEHLEDLVRKRTRDMQQANDALRKEAATRSKAIEALHRSEALLAEAQRIAGVGNYEWHAHDETMHCSDQVYRILGYHRGEMPMTFAELMACCLPEERDAVESMLRRAVETHHPFSLDHRMRCRDGRVIQVRHQGECRYAENGPHDKIIATLQDISAQHAAENQMRKLSAALEQTADSIIITDLGGKIEYVNQGFTGITGYAPEEVMGKTPSLLKSDRHDAGFYRRLWTAVLEGGIFSDVLVNRHKDGSLYHEEKTITPLKNAAGEITHFISTGKDITERVENQERIRHLAHHDQLTGLPNRMLLLDRIDQALARAKWHQRHVAVLFLDTDRFKVINDSLGHDIGDQVLKVMAQRLLACVRDGDTVARLGGDEFAVILNDVASEDDIQGVARKLLAEVGLPFHIHGRELYVTTSIGVSRFPLDGGDGQTLLKKADVAMYNAKAKGRNNYRLYTSIDETRALEKLGIESDLHRAQNKGEFFLVYQPQFDTKSGALRGIEALLRWRHPERGVVPPLEFIPLLEETGMILPVGTWVLGEACREAKRLQTATLVPVQVAVNISMHQFRQSEFAETVAAALRDSGLEPSLLEIELTEGVLIDDITETSHMLRTLGAMGVRVSIDDFGTGYSSLHYLQRLPIDTMKIDKSFVRDLATNPDDAAIVAAICTLAHAMNISVVAEGVETQAQQDFLQRLDCDAVQGYLHSRPLPAAEIESLLRRHALAAAAIKAPTPKKPKRRATHASPAKQTELRKGR